MRGQHGAEQKLPQWQHVQSPPDMSMTQIPALPPANWRRMCRFLAYDSLLQDEWRWCSVSTAQQQKNVLYCVVQCALLHKKAESNILLQFYLAATLYKLLITTTSIVLNVKCGGFIQINLSSNAALAVCDRLWNSVMLGCPVAPGDSGLLCVSVWRAIFFNRIYLNRNSLRWNFLSCFPTPVVPCISWGT